MTRAWGPADVDAVLRYLAEKEAYYLKLQEQVRLQEKALADGDDGALGTIAAEKERVFARIDALERATDALRREWNEGGATIADSDRARVRDAAARVAQVIEALMRAEEAWTAKARARQGAAAGDIVKIQESRRVRDVYGRGAGGDPRFFDGRS